jgi:hypothetical protein
VAIVAVTLVTCAAEVIVRIRTAFAFVLSTSKNERLHTTMCEPSDRRSINASDQITHR